MQGRRHRSHGAGHLHARDTGGPPADAWRRVSGARYADLRFRSRGLGKNMLHVKIGSGDALFIRTGRWARRAKMGAWNVGREAAGLHASTTPWIKQRDISLLGGDGVNDVQPSGVVGTGEAAGRPVQ